MRGIQCAAASRLNHNRLWNTGSPACAADDGGDLSESSLRRCERSEAIQGRGKTACVTLDYFVANAPRNDGAYAGRCACSPRKSVTST
jgi:hypothetical protein